MTSAKFEDNNKVHPIFSSREEGNVVLESNEGTLYFIPPYVLRNTSGLFRRMLLVSQQDRNSDEMMKMKMKKMNHIMINEKDLTVERMLRLMSGLETSKWESFDEVDAVLSLAYEWDAPGPISIIRSAITAPGLLKEPVRLYVLASRYGWEEEAKLASTLTLSLSIYDERYSKQLQRLSSKDLLKLLGLHRQRRDQFKARLDSDDCFRNGNALDGFCSSCGGNIDNHAWRELKARMFYELDQRPLGDTLRGLDIEEWPESIACWDAKCHNSECKNLNYSKLLTLRNIQAVLDQLPMTV